MKNLVDIMKQLRDPKNGCPWDKNQTYQSLLPYTIEEVYEVADAIEKQDFSDLKEELGDLLFQIVFYAQLASEDGFFDLSEVIDCICEKLVRRHPHVFSEKNLPTVLSEEEIHKAWEDQKHHERKNKSENGEASILDNIPSVLPELKRAQKIQSRVAKQGFDWENVNQVWDKLDEEAEEVKQAHQSNNKAHTEEEIGDLLFVCVNLARHYKVDADIALRKANSKFESRFREVEQLAQKPISNYNLNELEEFWQAAKKSKDMT